MSLLRTITGIAAALSLAACSLPTPDKEADAIARATYAQIRDGDTAALQKSFAPELRNDQTMAALGAVKAEIPPGQPTGSKLVGFHFNSEIGKGTTSVLTHAYEYPGKTVTAETVLFKGPGAKTWQVSGFHIKE